LEYEEENAKSEANISRIVRHKTKKERERKNLHSDESSPPKRKL